MTLRTSRKKSSADQMTRKKLAPPDIGLEDDCSFEKHEKHKNVSQKQREMTEENNNSSLDESALLSIVEQQATLVAIGSKTTPINFAMDADQSPLTQPINIEIPDDEEGGTKIAICPITTCNYEFQSSHLLTQHLILHHRNSNKCLICRKVLSSASSLDRHLLTHSGEKPFQCKQCDSCFSTNGNMHRHLRTHGLTDTSTHIQKVSPNGSEKLKRSAGVKRGSVKSESPNSQEKIRKIESEEPFSPLEDEHTSNSQNILSTSNEDCCKTHTDTEASCTFSVEGIISSPADEENFFRCPVCGEFFESVKSFYPHIKSQHNCFLRCYKCNQLNANIVEYKNHCCTNDEKLKNSTIDIQKVLKVCPFSAQCFPQIARNLLQDDAKSSKALSPKMKTRSDEDDSFTCQFCKIKRVFESETALENHEADHMKSFGAYCNTCKLDIPTTETLFSHQLKFHSYENRSLGSTMKENFVAGLNLMSRKSLESLHKQNISQAAEDIKLYPGHTTPVKIVKESELLSDPDYEEKHALQEKYINISESTKIETDSSSLPEQRELLNASPGKLEIDLDSNFNSDSNDDFADIPSIINNVTVVQPEEKSHDDSNLDENSEDDEESSEDCLQEAFQSLKIRNYTETQGSDDSYTVNTFGKRKRAHVNDQKAKYKCGKCYRTFSTSPNCKRHVRNIHHIPQSECKNWVTYNSTLSDFSTEPNLAYSCKYCGESFEHEEHLTNHIRKLDKSCRMKPYLCRKCNLGFATKNNCSRHILATHLKRTKGLVMEPEIKKELLKLIVSRHPTKVLHPFKEITDIAQDRTSSECSSPDMRNMSSESNIELQDRADAVVALMKLSDIEDQMEPLDLSFKALDLSNINSSNNDSAIGKSSFDTPSMHLMSDMSSKVSSISHQQSSLPDVLDLSMKEKPEVQNEFGINLTSHFRRSPAFVSNEISTNVLPILHGESIEMSRNQDEIEMPRLFPEISKDKSSERSLFKCSLCPTTFTLSSNLKRHIKNKHQQQGQEDRGPISGIKNATREKLHYHVLNAKANLGKKSSDIDSKPVGSQEDAEFTSDSENVDLASVSSVINTVNSSKFKQYLMDNNTPENINQVRSSDSPVDTEKENASIKRKRQQNGGSIKKAKTAEHQCPVCHKLFSTSSNLKRHEQNLHGGNALFLNGHNIAHGFEEKVPDQIIYECHICSSSYKSEDDCFSHMRELHPLEYEAMLGKEIVLPDIKQTWKNGLKSMNPVQPQLKENMGQSANKLVPVNGL